MDANKQKPKKRYRYLAFLTDNGQGAEYKGDRNMLWIIAARSSIGAQKAALVRINRLKAKTGLNWKLMDSHGREIT